MGKIEIHNVGFNSNRWDIISEGIFNTSDEELFEMISNLDPKTLDDILRTGSNFNAILNILHKNVDTTSGAMNVMTTLPDKKLYNYVKKNGQSAVDKIISFIQSHPHLQDYIEKYKSDKDARS